MNRLIEVANIWKGLDTDDKKTLRDYYNDNCFQLVKDSRKYKIQSNDNWCAMFTSVVAHKVGLSWFPYEVSVMEQVYLAKELNRFVTDIRKVNVGDLIVFDWDGKGWADHVGFVERIEKGVIITIEGNYLGNVGNRVVNISSKSIMGFILLDHK